MSLKRSVIQISKESHKIFQQEKISHQFLLTLILIGSDWIWKILIDSVDTYLPMFTDIIISSIKNSTFPEELSLAEVTLFWKMADTFDKVKYKPVSSL